MHLMQLDITPTIIEGFNKDYAQPSDTFRYNRQNNLLIKFLNLEDPVN